MNKTIVTIKAAWRPDNLAAVLMGLSKCRGFQDYNYFISIDLHPQYPALQEHHRSIIDIWSGLNHVTVNMKYADTVLGCAGNTIHCMNFAFNTMSADRVIHLEDDTVPYGDYFPFMEWGMNKIDNDSNYFAVCPFNRPATRDNQYLAEDMKLLQNRLKSAYTRPWFECGGGFGITRRVWEETIEAKGGLFGAEGNCNNPDLVGQAWKNAISVGNGGSWAWPINQYFRERSKTEQLCIFPSVGRVQNIGKDRGRFNPSLEFHQTKIYDNKWILSFSHYNKDEALYLDKTNLQKYNTNYSIQKHMPYVSHD